MTLEDDFKLALEFVKNAKDGKGPSNEQKLQFYAHFKQATVGENKEKRPGMMDVVGRAKHDAWAKLGKMSKEDAMKTYVKILEVITPDWKDKASKMGLKAKL